MRRSYGFTLIELMIVVAVIAIVASSAIPNLLSSRLLANETSAISTLRNFTSAQAQFQAQSAIDQDFDGLGEYGFLGELAGATPLNARGVGAPWPLDPSILSAVFTNVDALGAASDSGYLFQVFLPDAAGGGVPEINPAAVDADLAESLWSAYAWPTSAGSSGSRTFFVNHDGQLVQTHMGVVVYDTNARPPWNAALSAVAGDMSDPLGVLGNPASDGNLWTVVQ